MATAADKPDQSSDDVLLFDSSIICDPCIDEGNLIEADGYCVDCTQHLCRMCYQHHRRPTPMKHHQLLDRDHMPTGKSEKVYKDECVDMCTEHKDKVVDYFCEDHEQFGCSVCVTLGHRICNVGYIPKLSHALFESKEYRRFRNNLENMAKKTSSILDIAMSNLDDVKTFRDKTMNKIKLFRKEVNDFFDNLERKVVEKLSKIKMEDQKKMEGMIEQCKLLSEEIGKIENEVIDKETKGQKCRLYIDTKQLKDTLEKYDKEIRGMGPNNTVRHSDFIPSATIKSFMENTVNELGSLISFTKGRNIPVRTHTDKRDSCDITDIAVLPEGQIVVVDAKNNCIKLIDNKLETVSCSRTLSGFTGITAVPSNQIALIQNGDIHICTVTDRIKLQRTIPNCKLQWTVAYSNTCFIGCTSSYPYTLRIVDMNGGLRRTFAAETEGEQLIENIAAIAVTPDNTTIYISDQGKGTVTSLTFHGHVKEQYKYKGEWTPEGVAVSRDGLVYVCDSHNNLIHMLTADLDAIGVINGKQYGIRKPRGLAYCDKENKLYVGMHASQVIASLDI